MKRTFSLLFTLALATSANAGLITDPLGIQPPAPTLGTIGTPGSLLPGGVIDGGLTTDPLGANAPSNTASPAPAATEAIAKIDFSSAKKWINDLIGSQPEGEALRLSELMMIPDVFEALHATGREADELRGYMDWLLMTGVVIGVDGDDRQEELNGDPEDRLYDNHGDDEVSADRAHEIILGGPGTDTLQPQAPVNGFVFGTNSYMTGAPQAPTSGIILGGPGSDTVRPQAPVNGFVFGTNSYMTGAPQAPVHGIILGGPGSDTLQTQPPVNGFIFGEIVYLAGDSQDHNPDVAND